MALNPLRIDDKRARDLEKLAASSPEQLTNLIADLKRHPTGFPRLTELAQMFRKATSQANGQPIARLILSFCRFADQRSVPASEVFDAILEGLKNFKFPAEKIESLSKLRDSVVALMDLDILHNSYKAADLYFSHHRHLHDAKILTEIRPIFNLKRDAVGAFLLYSSLRFTLSDQTENEELFMVSLKKEEIESLRLECERALQKLAIVESDLKKTKPVIVYDERIGD